ncbi:hypothetical protein SLEP1_g50970 [Rubroshorea leprosula]|uniref:RPW8 domain-containing protein n=1 Tax=Rubroshorea leprosula TaxID=152421 RepID=A0AAV5M1Q7_9ROSI|nr:hypothetical protein SLEP1_g50970 [Rubroshorea leprosula]
MLITIICKMLITIICKSCLCKSSAEGLISTINELLSIIQEINSSGVELPPIWQVQLDRFSETLHDGLELCNEVLSSAWWNVCKNFQLARKMKKLEEKVARFPNGAMQAHGLADVLHMRFETAQRFERLEQRLGSICLLMMIFLQGRDGLP